MKFSKIAILLVVLTLCGGTLMFADAASQKVRVILNGSELDDSGLIVDNKTYLPLRQIANGLQAIVSWDNQTKKATLYKPNVHMVLFQDKVVFGNVDKGNRYTFNVLSQIDNLTTEVSAVKVSITDPNGTEKVIQSQSVNITKDNFWYRTEDIKYNFEYSGKYAVRFYMKTSASDEWTVVSEKLITSQ
ncbi:stalk domain-containing protein [Paenibacillus sp. NPDC058174]|uniref:stalk domain-containing protein n=1 Tax=Paenibacillus sp. NPDC058174 TaxID=3346366 RepID=UPI0036DBC939